MVPIAWLTVKAAKLARRRVKRHFAKAADPADSSAELVPGIVLLSRHNRKVVLLVEHSSMGSLGLLLSRAASLRRPTAPWPRGVCRPDQMPAHDAYHRPSLLHPTVLLPATGLPIGPSLSTRGGFEMSRYVHIPCPRSSSRYTGPVGSAFADCSYKSPIW